MKNKTKFLFVAFIFIMSLFLFNVNVNAEENETIEIDRQISLTYNDITDFNIYIKYDTETSKNYHILVYKIGNFFGKFDIDNKNEIYPYSIILKTTETNYKLEINQLSFNYYYDLLSDRYNTDDKLYFFVDYNDVYIVIDSRLKPKLNLTPPEGGRYYWSEFDNEINEDIYVMYLLYQYENNNPYIVTSMDYKTYFNYFGLYINFTQIYDINDSDYYDYIYQIGYNDGQQNGYSHGHIDGYSKGYKDGYAKGVSSSDGEVNAIASIFPGVIGSIWGVVKDFLTISIYGITPWHIFAALSSISLILLAIKIFK